MFSCMMESESVNLLESKYLDKGDLMFKYFFIMEMFRSHSAC